jgi:hypothetical protein
VAVAVTVAAIPAHAEGTPRIFAVGEVQGAYESLVRTLQAAGLIDDGLHWSGGDAIVVQTGDFLDDGTRVAEVMDLLMRLQGEAEAAGGRVIVLLGNHEVLNILGMRSGVNYETYQTFADEDSAARQAQAFEEYQAWVLRRAEAVTSELQAADVQGQAEWFAVHPPGYVEYVEAMGPTGRYGRWLRTLPATAKIDGNVFIHGGLSPELKGQSVDEINNKVAQEIERLGEYFAVMLDEGLITSLATAEDMSRVIGNEIKYLNAQPPRKLDRQRVELISGLQDFRHQWGKWYIVRQDGPMWFRGATEWDEEEMATEMVEILDGIGARAMVTGQSNGGRPKIEARFEGRVLLTSVGMSDEPWLKRKPACLEISDGDFAVISPHGREVLAVAQR